MAGSCHARRAGHVNDGSGSRRNELDCDSARASERRPLFFEAFALDFLDLIDGDPEGP